MFNRCHPKRILSKIVLFMMIIFYAGCVRLGNRLETIPLPPGAPDKIELVKGLAENETAMTSFRATGTVVIKIPEVESTQISRESTLHFRYPNNLYVIGRQYGTRIIELTYTDDAFLLEFPTRREYCLRLTAEEFNTLTSADIVREMFTPESWQTLQEDLIRITFYDEASQTATVELWVRDPKLRLKRTLLVQGAPWVILESQLCDKGGNIIAHTTNSFFQEEDGIRYPTQIETQFPGEKAWMRFTMRRVDVNVPIEDTAFDISGKADKLEYRGFQRVDIFAGEGTAVEELTTDN